MRHALLIPLMAALFPAAVLAQDRIYRCGNEYTNTVPDAQKANCKLLEGGNVTVVQGTRPAAAAPSRLVANAAAVSPRARVENAEQQSRDADARAILEAELRKAEARQSELAREYNNGEPEKRPEDMRNPVRYNDRVAELKASISRNDADIAGIRRELARVTGPR